MAIPTIRRKPAASHKPRTVVLRNLGRDLSETTAGERSPLKVDREKGIIYGVRVLGKNSRNTHNVEGVNSAEYSDRAMKQACQLYEGMTVRVDHADRKNPGGNRSVYDTFGQLQNCRIDGESVRADLHYMKSHDLAEAVCEDVERGLGVYGLSHNARAGKESVQNGRLIIEELELVRSVDLVDKPATNRNLWESHVDKTKKITLRECLESRLDKLSKMRRLWAENLLEDDAPVMDEPVETPTDVDPDEAMSAAFEASGMAILKQIIAGDLDAKEGLGKLKDLLMTHEKLTAKDEPADAPPEGDATVTEEEETDADGKKKDKTESYKERVAQLERKDACRDLCESLGFTPTKDQLADLMETEKPAARKRIAEAFVAASKSKAGGHGGPRSRATGSGRNVSESQGGGAKTRTTKSLLNRLR